MATESQYLFERNDALKSLWLVSQMPEFDMDTTPTIHFPTLSGEDLSIAKAGYDVVKAENSDFQVVLEQLWLFYLLTPSGLTLIRLEENLYLALKIVKILSVQISEDSRNIVVINSWHERYFADHEYQCHEKCISNIVDITLYQT